jgi:hypothetical protein
MTTYLGKTTTLVLAGSHANSQSMAMPVPSVLTHAAHACVVGGAMDHAHMYLHISYSYNNQHPGTSRQQPATNLTDADLVASVELGRHWYIDKSVCPSIHMLCMRTEKIWLIKARETFD